jgi:hypothetical protein
MRAIKRVCPARWGALADEVEAASLIGVVQRGARRLETP